MARGQRLRAFACSPTFGAVPAITGTAKVGSVLTASDGAPRAGSVARQWKRGGVAIAGATASTYTPVSADIGAAITVTITLTSTLRASNTKAATSAPTAAVVA
ncbi:hypothetical protein [Sphingomonas sp. BK235]|uniref:hypothetical protein n=1 Tax=Sphingomonas sp. BK235 TaxID=2512131 RepID=UPI0010D1AB5C|nr:hypothetical protein [Sphingomonas sp. BK235]TCP36544.1 hypothetical protein EV292_10140 [Sphingomonas sp. BK235]